MTLPAVWVYRKPEKRQPRQCLCVECGALRPSFYIPQRWVSTGLLAVFEVAFRLHRRQPIPPVIHMWEPAQ